MLTAISGGIPDYIPCSFMIFSALREKTKDRMEFFERQIELGLDTKVDLPELPFRYHPGVKVKTEKIVEKGEKYPLLLKKYHTPKGELTSIVRKTEDWPYGDKVPLFNDYLSTRSKKFLITSEEDIEKFQFLLCEPTKEDIESFREKSKRLKKFADKKGLLISGGWQSKGETKGIDTDGGTMGADILAWVFGFEKAIYTAMDNPEIIKKLLMMVSQWNKKRMEIYLEEKIDLLIRRAWYEGTELWSPTLYKNLIAPFLKQEIDLTHQAGAKFGYIITSGTLPLLEDFFDLGIDVIIGVDPLMGNWGDLKELKERVNGKISLWGGVNGFLTIERGKKEDVEKAVLDAISNLGESGGFILSPVDNVTDTSQQTWENVKTMIDVWKENRSIY